MLSRLKSFFRGDPDHLSATLTRRMFWTGLLIRLLYITFAHTYRIRLFADHFQFGWEMGRVGRALATGYGFSDPFMGHTGPTAWFPPLYPLLIGAVFKLFGVYSQLSAWILFAINSVFSAATAPAVYEIGARSFNRRVALWSGWLWALYPAAMQYATHWIWDMAITACLFTWVLVVVLRARRINASALLPLSSFAAGRGAASFPARTPDLPTSARLANEKRPRESATAMPTQSPYFWASFGLLWGLIALLNSSLLTFLPFCGLWMAWPELRTPTRLLHAVRNATLAATITAACIAPWIARNYFVFRAFIPMRANLGAELYMSSLESNNGFPWGGAVSIFEATPDMQRYKALGELAFCRERGDMGRDIFRAHPGRFRDYTFKRIWFYWAGVPHPYERTLANSFFTEFSRNLNFCFLSAAGLLGLALALRRRRPAALLYAGAFLFLPLTYYLLTVQARFRAPLEPLIFVLTVYLFQSADRTRRWSRTKLPVTK